MARKDMRGSKKTSSSPIFFRTVVNNGTSKGLNLTEFLKDWQQVRITVIEDNSDNITLLIEDTELLRV